MIDGHDDIHEDLRASVRAFADRAGGLARVRRVRDSDSGFDREAWSEVVRLGWLGTLVPELRGGAGLGLAEMAVVVREAARVLLPEPVSPMAVLAAGALARCDGGATLLKQLLTGEITIAVAWQELLGQTDCTQVSTRVHAQAGRTIVSGTKRFVVCGASADGYLVSANTPEGVGLYWVARDRPGAAYRALRRADGSEHGELSLTDVQIDASDMVAPPGCGVPALQAALDDAVVACAAELLGVAERALEITLDYLRTRVQFGKPIGSFQALQHRCVDLFMQKELGVSALGAALQDWPSVDDNARAALASRAKSRCADAALEICREAVQMHGAMGFTDECDIGLYLKRALTLSAWLGNARAHRRRYARLVLATPAARADALHGGAA